MQCICHVCGRVCFPVILTNEASQCNVMLWIKTDSAALCCNGQPTLPACSQDTNTGSIPSMGPCLVHPVQNKVMMCANCRCCLYKSTDSNIHCVAQLSLTVVPHVQPSVPEEAAGTFSSPLNEQCCDIFNNDIVSDRKDSDAKVFSHA